MANIESDKPKESPKGLASELKADWGAVSAGITESAKTGWTYTKEAAGAFLKTSMEPPVAAIKLGEAVGKEASALWSELTAPKSSDTNAAEREAGIAAGAAAGAALGGGAREIATKSAELSKSQIQAKLDAPHQSELELPSPFHDLDVSRMKFNDHQLHQPGLVNEAKRIAEKDNGIETKSIQK